MIAVSNAGRVVFPEIGVTKGDVVAYYERVAGRMLTHLVDRPLSLQRFPKGLAERGFFQKNVPPHYPKSIARYEVPKSGGVTVYPVVSEAEHLPYLANQGAIELHVPTARISDDWRPDRVVIDLDPPPTATALVRRAAHLTYEAMGAWGLPTVPVATGSKGYHVVAAIAPTIEPETLAHTLQQAGALLEAAHPDVFTTRFRIADRGERVFVDWLRNRQQATVIAPWSLRARPRATVAVPLRWDELDTIAPDAFTIADVEKLLERPDTLTDLAASPVDANAFITNVTTAFDRSGLVLEAFDRFRS